MRFAECPAMQCAAADCDMLWGDIAAQAATIVVMAVGVKAPQIWMNIQQGSSGVSIPDGFVQSVSALQFLKTASCRLNLSC